MSASVRAAARAMRAVVVREFGGPEVLKVEEVAVPQAEGKQVLIKVSAVGVNPVETYIRSGTHNIKPPLPWTPGCDVAGVVEEVGKEATKFQKGDRVFTRGSVTGAYAEFTVAEEDTTFRLADRLSFQQGAAIGVPYMTAYRALFHRTHGKPGETVLVHGASGGVGLAAVQLAKAHGMVVMGTAGSSEGMELVKKNGAAHVFNHREEGYMDKIMAATAGVGVDLIIEMLANVNLEKDLELLARHGRVGVVGNRGPTQINARAAMTKETSIIGVMLYHMDATELGETVAALYAGFTQGTLNPVVGREYSLEQAPEAHKDIIETKSAMGKVVLTV
ncbi:zeta-crystallin-like isoform X2 [Branchiostoma floridae]|uniref:Zeta-crystallin-like isoform X2 n=1 Tax=Branchiostoma floridae TaxID=7739 RepID=A0A9J7LM81_BRAFL|nr:zeta-crystallin-like isoform X2 [Branchiostoma floridae]